MVRKNLLEQAASALYFVAENGDPKIFNLGKYEELSSRCNDLNTRLQKFVKKHRKLLEIEGGVCMNCSFSQACADREDSCPAYEMLMELWEIIREASE